VGARLAPVGGIHNILLFVGVPSRFAFAQHPQRQGDGAENEALKD